MRTYLGPTVSDHSLTRGLKCIDQGSSGFQKCCPICVVLQTGNFAKGSNLIDQARNQLRCVGGSCYTVDEGILEVSVGLGISICMVCAVRVGVPVRVGSLTECKACDVGHCGCNIRKLESTKKNVEVVTV